MPYKKNYSAILKKLNGGTYIQKMSRVAQDVNKEKLDGYDFFARSYIKVQLPIKELPR